AYWMLARSFAAQQRYDAAIKSYEEAFEKATNLDDDGDDEKRQKQIDAYNDWAFALSESKAYDQSLKVSRQALQLKSDEFWTHFRLAYPHSDMTRYDQALAHYLEAKRIDPRNPYACHNIADLCERQGKYRSAREMWKKTVDLYKQGLADALRKRDANYCLYYG